MKILRKKLELISVEFMEQGRIYMSSLSSDSLPSTITNDFPCSHSPDNLETCSIPNTPDPFESYAALSPEEPVEQGRQLFPGKTQHPILILLANEAVMSQSPKEPPKKVSLMQALDLEGSDHSIMHSK